MVLETPIHQKRMPQRGARPRLALVVLACFALAALLLSGCRQEKTQLPLPLEDLMPTEWRIVTPEGAKEPLQALSIDGDEDKEWLLFFTYDNVGADGAAGPIGGVIYDAQQDAAQYDPQTIVPFPYQPSAFLVPYRLLPDWREGKGQGYLGNTAVGYELTSLAPARQEEDTIFNELNVWGKTNGVATRLSIFQWQGLERGYGVAHFVGSYNVAINERGPGTVARTITTLDRLNERSNLCKKTVYRRTPNSFQFPVSEQPTIVFCQGTPTAPTYPEAVVLAWLLSSDKNVKEGLVKGDSVEAVNRSASSLPGRVVSLTYDSTAGSQGLGQGAVSTVLVTSRLADEMGVTREYLWTLEEKKPQTVKETARWLITQVVQVQ